VSRTPHALSLERAPTAAPAFDYVLVGGGLQNGLTALALLAKDPNCRLAIVEREATFGGNHTWCFHSEDLGGDAPDWFCPLVVCRWSGYDVRFPAYERTLEQAYGAISSTQLDQVLTAQLAGAPHAQHILGDAEHLGPNHVTLADGRALHAKVVIDARGPEQSLDMPVAGFQKFFGIELTVRAGTAPPRPILMDATVEQRGGFRFVYVLPFSGTRVLLEDTIYATDATLDTASAQAALLAYAAQLGLEVTGSLRTEQGVLPLPRRWATASRGELPIRAGYAGGYFHPTTGYSLPAAFAFAELVASSSSQSNLMDNLDYLRTRLAVQQRFATWLNRLLFDGFEPSKRYVVLERFYRLDAGAIARFYALRTTPLDRARLLCGRPPRGFRWSGLAAAGGSA
jgi:lycopene beta-cyclase